MATLDMSVRYFGNAVDTGRMPVKDLAPALLALSEAFHEIQKLENPTEKPLSLDIQATKKGSFIVDLILTNGDDLLSKAIDLLNSDNSTAAINLATYITTFYGMVNLSKAAIGKKFKKQEKADEHNVKLTFDDGTCITIPAKSLEAYKDVEIRRTVKEVVKPVSDGDAAGIEFISEKMSKVSISSEQARRFEVPSVQDEELPATESKVALQIISVGFDNIKWRFSDGTNQFFASIDDKQFMDDVHNNKYQFGSTDILTVQLRQNQTMTENGLKSEYTIVKVLDLKHGARQIELDFE